MAKHLSVRLVGNGTFGEVPFPSIPALFHLEDLTGFTTLTNIEDITFHCNRRASVYAVEVTDGDIKFRMQLTPWRHVESGDRLSFPDRSLFIQVDNNTRKFIELALRFDELPLPELGDTYEID